MYKMPSSIFARRLVRSWLSAGDRNWPRRRRRAWKAYKGRDCSGRTPSPPVRSSPTPLAVEGNKGFRAIATQSVLFPDLFEERLLTDEEDQ